jgi:hypothetical protein
MRSRHYRSLLTTLLKSTPSISSFRLCPHSPNSRITVTKTTTCPLSEKNERTDCTYDVRPGKIKLLSTSSLEEKVLYSVSLRGGKLLFTSTPSVQLGELTISTPADHGQLVSAPLFAAVDSPVVDVHREYPYALYFAEIVNGGDSLDKHVWNIGAGEGGPGRFGLAVLDWERQKVEWVDTGLRDEWTVVWAGWARGGSKERVRMVVQAIKREPWEMTSGYAACLNKKTQIFLIETSLFKSQEPTSITPTTSTHTKSPSATSLPPTSLPLSPHPISLYPSLSPCQSILSYFYTPSFTNLHLFPLYHHTLTLPSTLSPVPPPTPHPLDRLYWLPYPALTPMIRNKEDIIIPSVDCGYSTITHIPSGKVSKVNGTIDQKKIIGHTNDGLWIVEGTSPCTRGRIGVLASDYSYVDWEDKSENDNNQSTLLKDEDIELEEQYMPNGLKVMVYRMKDYRSDSGQSVPLSSRPLYMSTHGGPHYFSSPKYSPLYMILLKEGFQIGTLDYSGSYSFTPSLNQASIGNLGTRDSEEIIELLKSDLIDYDRKDVTLECGSASGLHGVELLKKRPDLFKNIILFNPVVNYLTNLWGSDVPEWSLVEGLGLNNFTECPIPNTQALHSLLPNHTWSHPPPSTNILFILGDGDRRVPPSGSRWLHRELLRAGYNSRCLSYPKEGHSISSAKNILDYSLNILDMVIGFEDGNWKKKRTL